MKMQLYLLPFAILLFSYLMYVFFHKEKKRPILGEKRNNMTEYLNDYFKHRLYWSYLILLIFGLLILISLLLIDFIL
jgi:hypothetical protein